MEKRRVTINQPCIFPDLHLFERILKSNVSINMRTAQFSRQGWQSVYHIKTSQGRLNLTVPVKHCGHWIPINRAKIAWKDARWVKKHIRTIEQSYRKAPYFDAVIDGVVRIFMTQWEYVGDMALDSMVLGFQWLGEHVITTHDDELLPEGRPEDASNWVLAMCKLAGATEYYCGKIASDEYLRYRDFEQAGIQVIPQNWYCPEYRQIYPPFIGNLSILDLMFNVSPTEGRKVLGI